MDAALYNKYHRLVGLNGLNGYLFLTVLETKNLRSRCQQGGSF